MRRLNGSVGKFLGAGAFGIDNVPKTGMYLLHKGETVATAGGVPSGGITVNINGGYYLSEKVAGDIGDAIIKRLKRTMKL